jgi:hypothetical protein
MAEGNKNKKLIYHLTAIENLDSILENGLIARNGLQEFKDIADEEIIEHREKHKLNGYVPFHFIHSSPFAGKVQSLNPEDEFVYITVRRATAKKNNYKIIPKHPLALSNFELLDYNIGIEEIDWETLDKREFQDHECKMICLAECISLNTVPASDFFSIYCKSNSTNAQVKEILGGKPNLNSIWVNTNPIMFKNLK